MRVSTREAIGKQQVKPMSIVDFNNTPGINTEIEMYKLINLNVKCYTLLKRPQETTGVHRIRNKFIIE